MNKIYKWFWILFFIDGVNPIFTLALYVDLQIRDFFKVTNIVLFVLMLLFHVKRKIAYTPITLFLGFGLLLSILIGLKNINTMDLKVFSQLFSIIMPILSISFGVNYCRDLGPSMWPIIQKVFKWYIPLNIFLLICYYYLYYFKGTASYFGFQVNWQFISAYYISLNRSILFFGGIILVVLSGKRATLVTSLLPFLSLIKDGFLQGKKIVLISIIVITVLGSFVSIDLYEKGYFRRFEDTFAFDLSDDRATFLATSGRWQEIESITKHINQNSYQWITGCGLGDKYLFEAKFVGFDIESELKHYAHFTPFSMIFLFGVPLTLLIYGYFFYMIIKAWREYYLNFYYLCFFVSIIGAFFGANLNVDPKIWVFVGITYGLMNKEYVRN